MAAPMKVTHKLLKGSSTSSGTVFWGVLVHVIRQIRCQVNIDYHNQHGATICGELPELSETERGVHGYLSSLQRRVQNNRQRRVQNNRHVIRKNV